MIHFKVTFEGISSMIIIKHGTFNRYILYYDY
jgi:hypothetical protein